MSITKTILSALLVTAVLLSVPVGATIAARVSTTRVAWDDSLPCPVYWWSPASDPPLAVVVLLHGFAMHAQAYEHLAERMAQRGFAVAAIDMRGYGHRQSGFGSTDHQQNTIDYYKTKSDLQLLIALIRKQFPTRKIFLVGESLGSSMAIMLAADRSDVAGIILASPAVHLKQRVAVVNLPCALLHSAIPVGSINLSRCIVKLVAHEQSVRAEAGADPLIRRKYRATDIWKTVRFMRATARCSRAVPPAVSAYCLVASTDTLLSEHGSYQMFLQLGSANKCLQVFQDNRHVLLETGYLREDVLNGICHWLNDRLSELPDGTCASKPAALR